VLSSNEIKRRTERKRTGEINKKVSVRKKQVKKCKKAKKFLPMA
jgi:hypothetical protein